MISNDFRRFCWSAWNIEHVEMVFCMLRPTQISWQRHWTESAEIMKFQCHLQCHYAICNYFRMMCACTRGKHRKCHFYMITIRLKSIKKSAYRYKSIHENYYEAHWNAIPVCLNYTFDCWKPLRARSSGNNYKLQARPKSSSHPAIKTTEFIVYQLIRFQSFLNWLHFFGHSTKRTEANNMMKKHQFQNLFNQILVYAHKFYGVQATVRSGWWSQ